MSKVITFTVSDPDGLNQGEPGHKVTRTDGQNAATWNLPDDGTLLDLWAALTQRILTEVSGDGVRSTEHALSQYIESCGATKRHAEWVALARRRSTPPGLAAHVDKIPER